ncbi:MAG TPA: hypothetical protein VJY35_10855 [Candidatus Eisenbacteria bacterium]|nr:hypothetical protein [Candidatus Eisenbacteria bacterium]
MGPSGTSGRGGGSDLKRRFAARRRSQVLIYALFMVPVVVVALAKRNHPGPLDAIMGIPIRAWLIGFFALILGAIALSFRNWRCPACGGLLTRTLNHPICRRCGAELQ